MIDNPTPVIQVQIIGEAGYTEAMIGLSLSRKQPVEKMKRVAQKLANMDGGHNKYLEHIMLWVMVKAPRYFWQEADTYRISSKQSESSMDTLTKEIKKCKSDEDLEEWKKINIECPELWDASNLYHAVMDNWPLWTIKGLVPEFFMQRREWLISYKTLRNIILQRRNHRLPHWKMFISQMLEQVAHPELLPGITEK